MMSDKEAYGAAVSIRRQLITRLEGVNIKQALWDQVQWMDGLGDKPDDDVEWTITRLRHVNELIDVIEVE